MPPSSKVEATSWGKIRPGALRYPALAPPPLFSLIPGAERNPLGAIRREFLGPHGDERAVLPLEHVVLHARVRVLARLEQREGAVGVVAERLAEPRIAVAGRAGVHDRLDLEALLARLPPEEDGVLVTRDVMQDVGVRVLQLENDRGEVVGGERVVLG